MTDSKAPGYVYAAVQQPPPPYPGLPGAEYGATDYTQDPSNAPPGYNQATGYAQAQPVTAQPVQQTVLIHEYEPRPPSYMWLSCLVYFCCNMLFGAIAFALSMGSSSAADDGDMKEARKLSTYSLYMSITGVIITCIVAFIIVTLQFSIGLNQH